jgi:hypothetical protein
MKAWVLSERRRNGRERIVAIALTNEAATAWVRSPDMQFGEARTSMPYPIIELPKSVDAVARPDVEQESPSARGEWTLPGACPICGARWSCEHLPNDKPVIDEHQFGQYGICRHCGADVLKAPPLTCTRDKPGAGAALPGGAPASQYGNGCTCPEDCWLHPALQRAKKAEAERDALQQQVQAAQLLVLRWRGESHVAPFTDEIETLVKCADELAERIGMRGAGVPPTDAPQETP